ncbi:DNA-3-methyladenine glycosylase I [Paraglaciecola arctica]|uniref:DNA-3-methyladenine glycosylase I n=1 Tax=Paraglaciecola arctica TaxID=1128911 RepID=UPI001C07C9DD|nr:DNA-3-methyladenine glycosylase I [Paraglaciecola arctica]MBU3003472.1 DNA-3-methyladenine glycosylase I [Paraglaciecola arctica]
MAKLRCSWVSEDKTYQNYHDNVWGRAVTNSQELYAKLCLDGQQAGLSWITILKKQTNYEEAFCNFDPTKISIFTEEDVDRLMQNSGIVRNRLKIQSIIKNARAYLAIEASGMTFSDYIWQFVDGKTIVNRWSSKSDVPTSTPQSDKMAKALKKQGFSFVGTTICYAFMQAVGMVNDHTTNCFCYESSILDAKS